MRKSPWLGNLLLLLAALIWGCAFVAQSMGNEHVGPFTFQASRSLLGAAVLFPFAWLRIGAAKRKGAWQPPSPRSRRMLLWGGVACGVLLAVAMNLQQVALVESTAGKAGFLTALYILFVPLAGYFVGKSPRPALWLCILLAAVGLYLLSVQEGFTIARSDWLLILCAVVFTIHILVVDRVSPHVSGVQLSAVQFLVAGVLSLVLVILFEKPTLSALMGAWAPILYTGVLSSGVAYTLQIVGQRLTTPTLASLMMSLESVFAVLCGMLVLGESLSAREALGCVLMFGAILLAQWAQLPRKDLIVKEEARESV